jgi:hypothetical protein
VAAIVLVLVILFVIDPVVSALIEGSERYSLTGLEASLIGGSGEDAGLDELPPVWLAALLWAGYASPWWGPRRCRPRAATSDRSR